MTKWTQQSLGDEFDIIPPSEKNILKEKNGLVSIKELAAQYGEEALFALVNLMTSARSDHVKMLAAKEILDRAFGKPAQSVEVSLETDNVNYKVLDEIYERTMAEIKSGSIH